MWIGQGKSTMAIVLDLFSKFEYFASIIILDWQKQYKIPSGLHIFSLSLYALKVPP